MPDEVRTEAEKCRQSKRIQNGRGEGAHFFCDKDKGHPDGQHSWSSPRGDATITWSRD